MMCIFSFMRFDMSSTAIIAQVTVMYIYCYPKSSR
jgi:hypothetical protein